MLSQNKYRKKKRKKKNDVSKSITCDALFIHIEKMVTHTQDQKKWYVHFKNPPDILR